MTQYEIFVKGNEGKYQHFKTVFSIPAFNAVHAELSSQNKGFKVVTKYPDGTCCTSEYHAKPSKEEILERLQDPNLPKEEQNELVGMLYEGIDVKDEENGKTN